MDLKNVRYEVKGRIVIITADKPSTLNALGDDVTNDLYEAFRAYDSDPNLSCAILTGSGKAFIAGGDLGQMLKHTHPVGERVFAPSQKLPDFMEDMAKPVIAAVNGFALGGGCEIAMCCDIRIASTKAVFGQPEINMGIIPLMGGTQRLPRLVGAGMAKYMIFTGETIRADEAHRIGLVEKVVEPDELMAECEKLANTIASKSQVVMKLAKAAVNMSARTDLKTGLMVEGYLGGDSVGTEDRVEGMTAFFEKRPPQFKDK